MPSRCVKTKDRAMQKFLLIDCDGNVVGSTDTLVEATTLAEAGGYCRREDWCGIHILG